MSVELTSLSNKISVNVSGGITISASSPGAQNPSWGVITGTLSDQTDLQAALDAKVDDATVQSVSTTTATQVLTDSLHVLDTSSNVITDNLLAAALWTGKTLNIKKTSSLNKVTINPDGSELIDGAATFDFFNDNESITIMSDGTGIHIV